MLVDLGRDARDERGRARQYKHTASHPRAVPGGRAGAEHPRAGGGAGPSAAPVKKKHKAAPAKPINEPTVTLVPGPAEVTANINARGQAGLKGEVVTHLKKGETVTVLDQINLDKHKANEPAQWAKIALPSSTHVWVKPQYIDATSKTVSAKKLNLRAGRAKITASSASSSGARR